MINQKIEYWIDVWAELIRHFNNNQYGLELNNPHVALVVLIDEIENNELRNKETRAYLLTTIAHFHKHDPIIKKFLPTEFSLILQSFSKNSQYYLLQAAKAVMPFFREGKYFIESYNQLKEILADSNWKTGDESQIDSLSNSLIVELLLKGYSLKTIQDMPRNIFQDVTEKSHHFPTVITWEDCVDLGEEGRNQYKLKREAETKDLDLNKRLSAFTNYFTRKSYEHIFIFSVEGLKGDAEIQIGPVTFYSPRSRLFVRLSGEAKMDEMLKKFEKFGRENEEFFSNAAIRLSCIDPETGKNQAVEIADKALDLIRSRYNIECRLKVSRNQYLHLSKDGEMRGTGNSAGESLLIRLHGSFELKHLVEDEENKNDFNATSKYLFTAKDKQTALEQKITDCLHWLRKGEEADRPEDRLLHYWIVIEKVFTFPSTAAPLLKPDEKLEPKLFLISELLSAAVAYGFIYQIGRTLYLNLWPLFSDSLTAAIRGQKYVLPKEIAEKCGFVPGFTGQVSLKDFRESLDEICKAIGQRIIKNRILHVKKFYEDGDFAKEEIKRAVSRTKDDVLLIYRYRNSIVHNAHYDANLLMPFVEKAAKLAQTAVNMLTHERAKNQSVTVEELFISRYLEVQRILERLEKKLPIDSLEVPTWNVPSAPIQSASQQAKPPTN